LWCFAFHHLRASYKIFKKLKIPPEEVYKAIDGDIVYFTSGTRVEIYTSRDISAKILSFFSENSGIPVDELRELFSFISGKQAVEHLFRLTCKIESRVLGETYLPWKVEKALRYATGIDRAGELEHTFTHALATWKKVKKHTRIEGIDEHIKISAEFLSGAAKGVLLGAGLSGIKLAKQLEAEIYAVHRDLELAVYAAEKSHSIAAHYSKLKQLIQSSDFLICSTLASHYRVTPEMLREAKIKIVDLSPFDNVHPEVGDLPGVEVLNGKIQRAKQQHFNTMKQAVPEVEKIIDRELEEYD